MEKKIIDTVGFILVKNNKILVERRKETKRTDPGKICIPTGGIEERETNINAIKREVKEEFNIDVEENFYVGSLIYPNNEVNFLINYYIVTKWHGEMKKLEAEDIYWVNIDEEKLDIWPDKLIIKAIKKAKIGRLLE